MELGGSSYTSADGIGAGNLGTKTPDEAKLSWPGNETFGPILISDQN
jgi:hypothetical protein